MIRVSGFSKFAIALFAGLSLTGAASAQGMGGMGDGRFDRAQERGDAPRPGRGEAVPVRKPLQSTLPPEAYRPQPPFRPEPPPIRLDPRERQGRPIEAPRPVRPPVYGRSPGYDPTPVGEPDRDYRGRCVIRRVWIETPYGPRRVERRICRY